MKLMKATLLLALTPLCNASQEEKDFKAISDVIKNHLKAFSPEVLEKKIFKIGDEVEFTDYSSEKTVRVDATFPYITARDNDGNAYNYVDFRKMHKVNHQLGDRVRVRTLNSDPWQYGNVAELSPLKVQTDNMGHAIMWGQVSRELKIGDHVRIRSFESDPWTVGHVTQLAPAVHVKDHYRIKRKGFWNKVDKDSIIRVGDEVQLVDVRVRGVVKQTDPLKATDEYGNQERKFEDIHGMFRKNHQIGDRVRVRALNSDPWQYGTVKELSPLKVQTDNMDHAIMWGKVSRDWENKFDLMAHHAIQYPVLRQAYQDLQSTHDQEVDTHQVLQAAHKFQFTQEKEAHEALQALHEALQALHEALKSTHTDEKNTHQALEAKYTQEANARAEEKATLEKERNALETKREEEKTTLAAKHEEEKTTLEKESEKNRKLMIAFSVLFSLCAVAVIALSVLLVLNAKKTQSNSDNQAIA